MRSKRKIIVVDDEEDILNFLSRSFQKSYDVITVQNGGEAVNLFGKTAFDLVVTDINMPGINGIQLLDVAKTLVPDCEVILMTGFSDVDIVIKALNQGAFAFVTKPLDIAMVSKRIEDGLAVVRARENEKKVRKEMKNELLMQSLFAQRLSVLAAMSGGIAHELNQPLNGIGIYAATLAFMADSKNNISAPSVKDIAEEITQAVKKANTIIEHMKEFSSGANVGENRILNLKQAVIRSLNLFSVQLNSEKINLIFDIPDYLEVLTNQNRLEQVIINLVSNAKDSIIEKSKLGQSEDPENEIVIKASEGGDSIFLDVRDSGMGVSEELQSNLFEPFVTGKKTSMGSGLGLPICRRILNDFNSKLEVQESGPGGSTFRITFPRTKM
jgi:C4-dicarboxylate-specific signal transduction histidine kinase